LRMLPPLPYDQRTRANLLLVPHPEGVVYRLRIKIQRREDEVLLLLEDVDEGSLLQALVDEAYLPSEAKAELLLLVDEDKVMNEDLTPDTNRRQTTVLDLDLKFMP
jgi:hypothetical protein